jgi:hypothetical protein
MRSAKPLIFLPLFLFASLSSLGQGGSPSAPLNPGPTAPIPSDAHELATGPTQVATAPSEASSILALIERAREKSDLTYEGSAPFILDVTFDVSSPTAATVSGKIQETWFDPKRWQWTAQLGSYSQTRLFLDGKAYDENAAAPLPLRLQMVRDAIFWRPPAAARPLLRTTSATWNGRSTTCVLTSNNGSREPTPGRRWVEAEWCIDTQSGLLQIFSPVPGLYAVYEYDGAVKFRERVLPRQIVVYENGREVLHVRVDRIRAADLKEASLLSPSEQMKANGPKDILEEPVRLQLFGNPPQGADNAVIEPVFVHVMLGANQQVSEEEVLQTPSPVLVQAALDRAKVVVPNSLPPNSPSYQREVFLNLQFNPASRGASAGNFPPAAGASALAPPQPVARASSGSTRAAETRLLTLICPGDPDFDSALDANFPGFRQLNDYPTMRPLLALVRNDGSHAAVAYTIRWTVQMPDGTTRQVGQNQFIQKYYWTPQDAIALAPGGMRLTSPFFVLGLKPGDPFGPQDFWSRLLSTPIFAQAKGNPVICTEDVVIYDDGSYVGIDVSLTSLRYQASRDAAHDEAAALLQVLENNSAVGDVLLFLENEQRSNIVNTSAGVRREVLYPYYRNEVAQRLETTYRQSGLQGLRNRAQFLANDPRPEIVRVGDASR